MAICIKVAGTSFCTILAMLSPMAAQSAAQTAQAWASGNQLGTGPYVVVVGPNAAANSAFSYEGAEAEASAMASGRMFVSGASNESGLNNGIGGLADVRYTARLRGPSGASVPLTIAYSFTFSMDLYTEFTASSLPQSVANGIVTYTMRAGSATVSGQLLEVWQNGLPNLRIESGVGAPSRSYDIVPSVVLEGAIIELTQADLVFLGVSATLLSLSPGQLEALDLASVASAISQSVFALGLPSRGIAPGLSVGVGFGVACLAEGSLSDTIQLGSTGHLVGGAAQNSSKSGPGASSATNVTLTLSSFSVAADDLPLVLADPRFFVLADGRLGYADGAGAIQPVAVIVDGSSASRREFSVFAGEHAPCAAISVSSQPAASACTTGGAVLSVDATGTEPIAYQWRRGGCSDSCLRESECGDDDLDFELSARGGRGRL